MPKKQPALFADASCPSCLFDIKIFYVALPAFVIAPCPKCGDLVRVEVKEEGAFAEICV